MERESRRSGFVSGRWCGMATLVVFFPAACTNPDVLQTITPTDPVLQDEALAAPEEGPSPPPQKPLDKRVVELLDRGPDLLIGVGRNQLTAYLGTPALVRHDAPAEIWTYQSQTCHLDLFLYSSEQWRHDLRERERRQETDSDYRVTYYEVRSSNGKVAPSGRSCVSTLITARESV